MSVVVTSFSNDESARPSTLLETEFTKDILIYQVRKFQNGYFKKHLWKATTILQKACILRACYEICSWWHPSKITSIEIHRNT